MLGFPVGQGFWLANHKAGFKGIPKEGIQWFNGRARGLGFKGVELKTKTGLGSTTTTSPYLYSTGGHSMSQEEVVIALYSVSQDMILPWDLEVYSRQVCKIRR